LKRFGILWTGLLLGFSPLFSGNNESALENVGDLISRVLKFGSAPFVLVRTELAVIDSFAVEADSRRASVSAAIAAGTSDPGSSIAPFSLMTGLVGPLTTLGEFPGPVERYARFSLRFSLGILDGLLSLPSFD
jgi:hypothetical protein